MTSATAVGRPVARPATPGPPPGPLLAIVGPTATGKSDLAVAVALAVGGEIVNADASQLYRGMDIGTAKLAAADRAGVPHHLFDVLDVTDEANVEAYQRTARAAIADIVARDRLPILVGGSGLYVSAVLDPLAFPGTDPMIRSRLEAELADDGPAALHARLSVVDPAAAAVILAGNGRRIVRALEVVELTGAPFTARLPPPESRPDGVRVLRTEADPAVLSDRIAARVEAMWAAGLVEEVRGLLAAGLRDGRTASRALGYAQVLALFDGVVDEASARAETVRATRRFARRQRSWFGRETGAVRCPAESHTAGPYTAGPHTAGPDAVAIAVAVARDCLRAAGWSAAMTGARR